jgi:ERCC4-type nuclease
MEEPAVKFHYTDAELKALLSGLTILIDTREQENGHITDYLAKHKIPHISKKLNVGDYSAMLPANPELGIIRDTYFTGDIAIERKASLDELSNNLTANRAQFEAELIRAHRCKLLLMVEDAGYADIVNHRYRSQYDPKSFIATLATYTARYDLNINFVPVACAGNFIYFTIFYHIRNYLLGR